ncbi:MAG TPA: DUF5615 family PIN-like protein [Pyrinomonadaceae bacterium]|nr:DUF5615 family PIN-like protein [Pyrinomonadaceae bacterium]
MNILIDECLDWRLCRALINHQCSSVHQSGWTGVTNGELLEKAQERFDVFLTGDRNLTFQQNVPQLRIAVIVLEAKSTRLRDTLPLMTQVLASLERIQAGQVVRIGPRH